MRTVFFLLLLANVAFLAYSRFGGDWFSGEGQLLDQQINPQAIRLLAPEQVVKQAGARREAPAQQRPPAACLEWGSFVGGETGRAEEALAQLALGAKLSSRRVDEATSWWVFISPQGSRQAAINKAGELKRLGVTDFFVLQDDPKFRFAISLGIFRTEEAAKAHLDQLRTKGVRTAQVGAREAQLQRTWFQVRDATDAIAAKLNELSRGFPGSDVKECAVDGQRT